MSLNKRKLLFSGIALILWTGALIFLLTADLLFAETHAIGDTVPLVFEIFDLTTGEAITGQSPTVGIFRLNDSYWLDWDDLTFKDSGWTEQFSTMSEIESLGRYQKEWDTTAQSPSRLVAVLSNTGDYQTEGTISFQISTSPSCPDCPPLGSGSIPINHDYPNPGDQVAKDPEGAPLADVYVRIYLKTNYDQGFVDAQYVEGFTFTTVDGTWEDYIYLDPGEYTSVFQKRGYQVVTFEFTVTAP